MFSLARFKDTVNTNYNVILVPRVCTDRCFVRESQDKICCSLQIVNTNYRRTQERNRTVRVTNTQKEKAEKDDHE